MKIYIAGPYTAPSRKDRFENVNRAIDAGIELLRMGHVPFIPHLTHFVDERAMEKTIRITWEDYIAWDIEWLKECDALLFLGHSKGATLERDTAIKLNKKIFYSIESIPKAQVQGTTDQNFVKQRA